MKQKHFDLQLGLKTWGGGGGGTNLFQPFAEKSLEKLLEEFTLGVESISKY